MLLTRHETRQTFHIPSPTQTSHNFRWFRGTLPMSMCPRRGTRPSCCMWRRAALTQQRNFAPYWTRFQVLDIQELVFQRNRKRRLHRSVSRNPCRWIRDFGNHLAPHQCWKLEEGESTSRAENCLGWARLRVFPPRRIYKRRRGAVV